jgi:hypothetical protein
MVLYSLIIGICIVLIQREAVHFTLRQKNPGMTKDQVTQVILAAITFPYVVGFTLVVGWIGYVTLAIASLYGLYLMYTVIIRAIITLYYL